MTFDDWNRNGKRDMVDWKERADANGEFICNENLNDEGDDA